MDDLTLGFRYVSRAEYASRAEYFRSEHKRDGEKIEQLKARLEAAEAEVERLRDARDNAEADLGRTEDLLGLAQHERDEARAEIGRLLKQARAYEEEVGELVTQRDAAQAEAERLRALETKSREYADMAAEKARKELRANEALIKENTAQRREAERLRAALADIAAMTDADDPESYRSDDREGCLDAVYAKARRSHDAA